MILRSTIVLLSVCLTATAFGQIPKPDDAPQPLPPNEAVKSFKLPPGLRLELVASEPLIREPSGVCWDEHGRLFVCELHGFNLDGQIDIDELNKTGKLDKVVRRFFVPEHVEKAAEAGTFGTVKHLIDSDGDGRMDKAEVWADRLPACFGICPARGGIIVVCAPDIVFLADRDGDGKAEVREVLFTGFSTGVLDRRMGTPQWGLDDWIYVGRSHSDATITGPHLKPVADSLRDPDSASLSDAATVHLPNTDFRIKPDGSAIEPVSGAVSGLGHTITESGDRFVSSVGWPAHFVAPLPWHSLARNPYVATPPLTVQVFPDRRVYPTSKAHPWRTKRAEDPGFSKFYTDGWGIAESAPNGYFTSCCGPLVYQDSVLPSLRGQLLACEPAQNLIHRSVVTRDGLRLMLSRAKGEESSEFLTSTDSWFHPIALSHGPDGCVWITDFYREIIEDYSAIPRYLQQQYGVTNGKDHGRIWRLTSDDVGRALLPVDKRDTKQTAKSGHPTDMSQLSAAELAREVGAALYWRRQTARRLLTERKLKDQAPALIKLAHEAKEPAAVINALHTLDALSELKPDLLEALLAHTSGDVRRQALQLSERRLEEHSGLLVAALRLADDSEPIVRLQLALSLGASRDARVLPALARFARQYGDDPWMTTAILSAVGWDSVPTALDVKRRDRVPTYDLLAELLRAPNDLKQAQRLLEPLCAAIAARRQEQELGAALVRIAGVDDHTIQVACLVGIRSSFGSSSAVALSEDARLAVKRLTTSDHADVRSLAGLLVRMMKLETSAERETRLAQSKEQLNDVTLNADARLAAIAELAAEDDASIAPVLMTALTSATPRLHEAILSAVFSRRDRIPALLDALEQKTVAPTVLSAVQRSLLLEDKDAAIRSRAGQLLTVPKSAALELFPVYAAALKEHRDVTRGHQVFRQVCGNCHQAHGLGVTIPVGPDLSSEFQRAEETIIRDILAPSEVISPGYMTYTVATKSGQVFSGLLGSESPTSLTLKQPPKVGTESQPTEGKLQVILRNEIDEMRVSAVSLMPEDLVKSLKPQDVADLIAWLRQPQERVVLLDDNPNLAAALNEGTGTAEFITSDKFSGESSLRITPPQRFSPRIKGWEFRIREKPAVGEYRFIRFAWKSPQASGVMLEFADDGQWPPADQTLRRYFAGKNLTGWQAVGIAPRPPADWTVMTRDLWQDFGDFTLTGFAPTAIAGPALFDRIELFRTP